MGAVKAVEERLLACPFDDPGGDRVDVGTLAGADVVAGFVAI